MTHIQKERKWKRGRRRRKKIDDRFVIYFKKKQSGLLMVSTLFLVFSCPLFSVTSCSSLHITFHLPSSPNTSLLFTLHILSLPLNYFLLLLPLPHHLLFSFSTFYSSLWQRRRSKHDARRLLKADGESSCGCRNALTLSRRVRWEERKEKKGEKKKK